MRYLRSKSKLKIVCREQKDPVVLGETDANWSGDQNDRKSITDFRFKYGQHSVAISLQVRKQQAVALSSCETEYQGLAAAVQEVLFLAFIMRFAASITAAKFS